jgi:NTP pyrophosphatase (non-canonical NTP hydrolase)
MDFNEYQEKASQTAIYLNKLKDRHPNIPDEVLKYMGLSYVANGLGEVGEIQGKVKKILRDNAGVITEEHREALKSECSDVLWYCAALCTELGISLNDVAEHNIKKLADRQSRNQLNGSGDNR